KNSPRIQEDWLPCTPTKSCPDARRPWGGEPAWRADYSSVWGDGQAVALGTCPHLLGTWPLGTLPPGALPTGPLPLGTSGMDLSRAPQAAKIAFAIAGATATIGVSPPPADGSSGPSSSTTSTDGRSASRGTRYCDIDALRIFPSANSIASNNAPPRPIMTAPSIWFRRLSGLTTAPQSNAATSRSTCSLPSLSTRTSAAVATRPPFSIPPAIPTPPPAASPVGRAPGRQSSRPA